MYTALMISISSVLSHTITCRDNSQISLKTRVLTTIYIERVTVTVSGNS
jgi:hypothetical protein